VKRKKCLEALSALKECTKEIEAFIINKDFNSAMTEAKLTLPELTDDLIEELDKTE